MGGDDNNKQENTESQSTEYDFHSIAATKGAETWRWPDTLVSHVTNDPKNLRQLTGGGIRLQSHPENLFGSKAFYTTVGLYNHVEGPATILYEVDNSLLKPIRHKSPEYVRLLEKYGVKEYFSHTSRGDRLISFLKRHGYNAIEYEMDTKCYAIIDKPNKLLKPIGAYPIDSYGASLVSLRTIKGIRAAGTVGLGYSIYHSGRTIAESDDPLKETAHQGTLLGVSMAAGAWTASLAMPACFALGAACPVAAPASVPVCLAGASTIGSTLATLGTEYLWHKATNPQFDFRDFQPSAFIPSAYADNLRLPSLAFSKMPGLSHDSAYTDIYNHFPIDYWQQTRQSPSDTATNYENIDAVYDLFLNQNLNILFSSGAPGNIFENSVLSELINSHLWHDSTPAFFPPNAPYDFFDLGNTGNTPGNGDLLDSVSYIDSEIKDVTEYIKEINSIKLLKQSLSYEEVNEFIKAVKDRVLPAEALLLDNLTEIDISEYLGDAKIVGFYNELSDLKKNGGTPEKVFAKAQQLTSEVKKVSSRRKEYAANIEGFKEIGLFASALGDMVGNDFLQTSGILISTGAGISSSIMALSAASSFVPILGAALSIGTCMLNLLSAMSSNNAEAENHFMELISLLSIQIGKLQQEMHIRFDDVTAKLDVFSRQQVESFYVLTEQLNNNFNTIKYLHAENQRLIKRSLSYLETIVKNQAEEAKKRKKDRLADQLKSIVSLLTVKRKELDFDSATYAEYRSILSTQLTTPKLGINDDMFTGYNVPSLANLIAVNAHIDGFAADFHLGTLVSLYEQLGFKNKNYSPQMVNKYLMDIIQNNLRIQVVPYLRVTDIISSKFQQQKQLTSGIEEITRSFYRQEYADGVGEVLVVPIILHAKWHLVIIDKLLQEVSVFSPPSVIPDLKDKLLASLLGNAPKDFVLSQYVFSKNCSPIYFGAIIIEIVRNLESNKSYSGILNDLSAKKCELLVEAHDKLFHPDKELLATRDNFLWRPINPLLAILLSMRLLEVLYHKYPDAKNTTFSDLIVDAAEIADIKSTLFSLEMPHNLLQSFSDPSLFELLFTSYKESMQNLLALLINYRSAYEEARTNEYISTAKAKLISLFTDQAVVEQFNKNIEIKVYGNWFDPVWYSCRCFDTSVYRPCAGLRNHWYDERNQDGDRYHNGVSAAWSAQAKKKYIIDVQSKINAYRDAFLFEKTKELAYVKLNHRLNIDFPDVFVMDIVPLFIMPEQHNYPVLPNLLFTAADVPDEMLRAQAFIFGYIKLTYYVDDAQNQFTLKVCFVMNDSNTLDCVSSYSIQYLLTDENSNFYEGSEAVWNFFMGGNYPSEKIVPRQDDNRVVTVQQWCTASSPVGFGHMPPYYKDHQGAGFLPLSSFSRANNTATQLPHPLMVEINKRLADKYLAIRIALNRELKNTLGDYSCSLGHALSKFENSYKILRLFLEFVIPGAMNNPGNPLYVLLHNSLVHNEESLLTYLSGQTDQFVADQFVSTELIDEALEWCLQALPTRANHVISSISEFQKVLLEAYADFIPYQAKAKPSPQDQSSWEAETKDYLERSYEFIQDKLLEFVYLSSDEQRRIKSELPSISNTKSGLAKIMQNIKASYQDIDARFKTGEITLEEARNEFQQIQYTSNLPALPAGEDKTHVNQLSDDEKRVNRDYQDAEFTSATSGATLVRPPFSDLILWLYMLSRSSYSIFMQDIFRWDQFFCNSRGASKPENWHVEYTKFRNKHKFFYREKSHSAPTYTHALVAMEPNSSLPWCEVSLEINGDEISYVESHDKIVGVTGGSINGAATCTTEQLNEITDDVKTRLPSYEELLRRAKVRRHIEEFTRTGLESATTTGIILLTRDVLLASGASPKAADWAAYLISQYFSVGRTTRSLYKGASWLESLLPTAVSSVTYHGLTKTGLTSNRTASWCSNAASIATSVYSGGGFFKVATSFGVSYLVGDIISRGEKWFADKYLTGELEQRCAELEKSYSDVGKDLQEQVPELSENIQSLLDEARIAPKMAHYTLVYEYKKLLEKISSEMHLSQVEMQM